jgi:hypothetical protein
VTPFVGLPCEVQNWAPFRVRSAPLPSQALPGTARRPNPSARAGRSQSQKCCLPAAEGCRDSGSGQAGRYTGHVPAKQTSGVRLEFAGRWRDRGVWIIEQRAVVQARSGDDRGPANEFDSRPVDADLRVRRGFAWQSSGCRAPTPSRSGIHARAGCNRDQHDPRSAGTLRHHPVRRGSSCRAVFRRSWRHRH